MQHDPMNCHKCQKVAQDLAKEHSAHYSGPLDLRQVKVSSTKFQNSIFQHISGDVFEGLTGEIIMEKSLSIKRQMALKLAQSKVLA